MILIILSVLVGSFVLLFGLWLVVWTLVMQPTFQRHDPNRTEFQLTSQTPDMDSND
jgi:hypothetical protein